MLERPAPRLQRNVAGMATNGQGLMSVPSSIAAAPATPVVPMASARSRYGPPTSAINTLMAPMAAIRPNGS
jgi:hypothetical protein